MKHRLLAFLLTAVVAVTVSVVAQDNGSNNDQQSAPMAGPSEHGRGHFDPQRRTEMLTKQLKLTSDQQAKVLDILKSQQSQMESLRSDSSLSQDDRRSKMMDMHKASDDQIRTLLDSNQQKKWDEMQSKHQQWQGHHGDGQGAGAAPNSSPQN